jgi:hypothetical protein
MTDLKQNVFKYNMSFYYQSTIIYFIIFIIYVVVRGEFVEDSYKLFTHDPIIYFLGLIVIVSVISLLYNLYKKRHIKITSEGIHFIDRFGTRTLQIADIEYVKLARETGRFRNIASRLIRIKLKKRRRLLLIRPNDYENTNDLLLAFGEVKKKVEERNV